MEATGFPTFGGFTTSKEGLISRLLVGCGFRLWVWGLGLGFRGRPLGFGLWALEFRAASPTLIGFWYRILQRVVYRNVPDFHWVLNTKAVFGLSKA